MIELYHCADARSFRALWLLEELKLPYRLHRLAFPPRRTTPDYLEINPLGTIPFLVDGDTRMSESIAMLQYLAARYGDGVFSVGQEESDFGAFLDWLAYGEATLTTPQTVTLRYRHLEPEERKQPIVANDYERIFHDRLKKAQRALEQARYLCAGRFTVADISVGYAILLAGKLGYHATLSPELTDYWQRLQARPGFKAAKQSQKIAA